MIPEYKTKTNIWVAVGLGLQAASMLLSRYGVPPVAALVVRLVGFLVLIGGCFYYAQAKGYSRWWGLLGLFNLLGLLLLVLFRDRHKNYTPPEKELQEVFE